MITGEGNDLVVLDEQITNPNNLITVSDLKDVDKIRFYNPETNLFVDVPFQIAREQILAIKSEALGIELTELITPEVLVGIVDLGSGVSGLICDQQSDLPARCLSIELADNNNNEYAP